MIHYVNSQNFDLSNRIIVYFSWTWDALDVSLQGVLSTSVEFERLGLYIDVRAIVARPASSGTVSLRLHVRLGSEELGIVEHFDDKTQFFESSLSVLEVRDTQAVSLVSSTPTEGPLSRSTLIVLGLTGAAAFLEKSARVTCTAHMTGAQHVQVVEALVPLSDWLEKGPIYQETIAKKKIWSFMATSGREAASAYAAVVSKISKAANSDPEAIATSAVVVIRTSTGVLSSQQAVFELSPGDESTPVHFNFSFVAEHQGPAIVVRASTDLGTISKEGNVAGGLSGGELLFITVKKFPIIFQVSELVVKFGFKFWPVSKLYRSDHTESSFVIQVPPNNKEGDVLVQIYSKTMSTNRAILVFNYYDNRFPKILHVSPGVVYEGGEKITVFMSNFPIVSSKEDASVVLTWGDEEPVSVSLLSMTQGSSGVVVATLNFLAPEMPAGTVFMVVRANSKESDAVTLESFDLPTSPPTVSNVDRGGKGMCTGTENVLVKLEGIRMAKTHADLTVVVGDAEVETFNMFLSTLDFTLVSFTVPASAPGLTSLRIWSRNQPSLVSSIPFLCTDPHAVELIFVSPTWAYAGMRTRVLVGVSKFGKVDSVLDVTVLTDSSQVSVVVSLVTPAGASQVTEIAFDIIAAIVGSVNVTLVASEKNVRFELLILDTGVCRVSTFSPQSALIYGGSLLTLTVDNWPASASKTGGILNIAGVNLTLTSLESQSILPARFSVRVPSVAFPRVVFPVLMIPHAGHFAFPSPFTYVAAPTPKIRATPARAPTGDATTKIQVRVADLAPVSNSNDLAVQFVSSTGSVFAAQVRSSQLVGASGSALSDLTVNIVTPMWQEDAGIVTLLVFHRGFAHKIASTSFELYDIAEPRLERMESEDPVTGLVQGERSLRIAMSTPSQIRLLATTVSQMTASPAVKVGGTQIDVTFSEWDADDETADLVFNVPASVRSGDVYGLVSFAGSFSSNCATDCCATLNCAACGRGILCFTLVYFDDSQPGVLLLSESTGPDVGGQALRIQLVRFPQVSSANELSAYFLVNGSPILAQVALDYSSEDNTMLQVVTPHVSISSGATQRIVDVNIGGQSVSVSFKYEYMRTDPFAGVPHPSLAPISGGITVYVTLHYFAFPSEIQVLFGAVELARDAARIHHPSNVRASRLSFDVPTDLIVRNVDVTVQPRGCTDPCTQAVVFNLMVYDDALPTLSQPIPSSGPVTDYYLPVVLVDKLPSESIVSSRLVSISTGAEFLIRSGDITKETRGGLTALYIAIPFAVQGGGLLNTRWYCHVMIDRDGSETLSLDFPVALYNPNRMRVVSTTPIELPTAIIIGGKRIHSSYIVTIVCAKCPAGEPKTAYSASVGSERAEVTSVIDVNTCAAARLGSDCVRTHITIEAPVLNAPSEEVPVVLQRRTASGEFEQAIAPSLRYSTACNYDKFCDSEQPDIFLLMHQPLAALQCDFSFCVVPADIKDPIILSVSPDSGSEFGGTQVSLRVSNLPAFDSSDVIFIVHDGSVESRGQVLSLRVATGSSLQTGVESVLLLQTPARPGTTNRQVFMMLRCSLLGTMRKISFAFKYERDISGPATVVMFSPQTIHVSQPLEIAIRLGNFPTMMQPFDADQIMVRVFSARDSGDAATAPCNSVMGSNDESTSILVIRENPARGWPLGILTIESFWMASGASASGVLNVSVIADPIPKLISSYPDIGSCNDSSVVDINVAHMAPSANIGWIRAMLLDADNRSNAQSLQVLDVQYASDADASDACITSICSLAKIRIVVGPFSVCSPGSKVINLDVALADPISNSNGARESIDAHFQIRESFSPRVQGVNPSTFVIGDETVFITLYLADFPSCEDTSCDLLLVSLHVGGITAVVTELVKEENGLLKIKMRPPIVPPGRLSCTVNFMQTEAAWQISAMRPAAGIEPVDGLVAGGSEVTITAAAKGVLQGDGLFDTSDSLVNYATGPYFVFLGHVEVQVIGHSLDQAGPILMVTVKVTAPAVLTAGYVWYSLRIGSIGEGSQLELARLAYEYYQIPSIVWALPASALHIGVTNSKDGQSTQLRIENFPPTFRPADFAVSFGAINCETLCAITSIEMGLGFSILTVTVPILPVGKTAVSVAYIGAPLPPLGNDGSKFVRTQRSAELTFQVLLATPAFLGIKFCQVCGNQSCLSASGMCGDNAPPLSSKIPSGIAGFLVVEIDKANVFETNNKAEPFEAVSATAFLSGNSQAFLTFKQLVVIDRARGGQIALEFMVPKMISIGKSAGTLEISSHARPFPVSLGFQVDFFSSSLSLECVGMPAGCQGPNRGANVLNLRVTNMPIVGMGIQVSDILVVNFGPYTAASVKLLSYSNNIAVLSVVPPECKICTFIQGSATIRLTIALRSDPSISVSVDHTYWRSPRVVSSALGSLATTVMVSMDQSVNRIGGVLEGSNECSQIFGGQTLILFGLEPTCSWTTDSTTLQINLGSGTSVMPGNFLVFKAGTMATANGLAANEQMSNQLAAPEFPRVLSVVLEGPSTVDMCSSLSLRATAASSRAVLYNWACYDNAILHALLQTENGSVLSFRAGTPEMTVDTSYTFAVAVTDFLGSQSEPATVRVTKQRAPVPVLTFSPPHVAVVSTDEVSVSAGLEFSACSGSVGQMSFTWKQVDGPMIAVRYISGTSSQLFIPASILLGGNNYVFALQVVNDEDPSQTVLGRVQVTVKNAPLIANIVGGSSMQVSTSSTVGIDFFSLNFLQ